MVDYQFRIRFEIRGSHVHCRLFSQPITGGDYQLLGNFVVSRGDEFRSLMSAFIPLQAIPDHGSLGVSAALDPSTSTNSEE